MSDPTRQPGGFESGDYAEDLESPWDAIPVRSMVEADLDAVVRIDRKLTGRERTDYFARKLRQVMGQSGIRVSLVAEIDGMPVGFVMARVDYGEFGHTEPAAVLDTIGVHPDFAHRGVGRVLMSRLIANLDKLHVDVVRTSVAWDDFALLRFLEQNHFKPAQHLVLTKTIELGP